MNLKTIYISLFTLSLMSCADIIESDLGDKKIILLAPSDSARNDKSSQTFFWQDLREDKTIDLEKYNLQIAEPSFDNANRFVLDTNITTNTYTHSLIAGEYEWRVRGKNANTKTLYTTNKLFIDTSFILTNETLVLVFPLDGGTIPLPREPGYNIVFRWNPLPGADLYSFQLIAGSSSSERTLIVADTTSKSQYSRFLTRVKFDENKKRTGGAGSYEWTVTATNYKTKTSTTTTATFLADTTSNTN